MRPARKLFLLAAMALTAIALTATTASAQGPVEILDEETSEHCGTVGLDGHEVTGGCHIAYRSEGDIALVAYTPRPVVLANCLWHFEAQIGEDGAGYATEVLTTDEQDPPTPGCTRTPCDEAAPSHEELPWPLQIEENAAAQESVELEICLRLTGTPEGSASGLCEVHLPIFHDAGTHNHDIGVGGEHFCEVSPHPFPISFQNVAFHVEDPAEHGDMEITH